MQWSYPRKGSEVFLPLTLAAVQAVLIAGIIWQMDRSPDLTVQPRATGGEVVLTTERIEADAIAMAHTPGRVLDTDVIRDNGIISYLILINPEQDGGDTTARRVLFIDPVQRTVWRDESWSTRAERAARTTRAQAETTAIAAAGGSAKALYALLQRYDDRDVWQVKVARTGAPSLLYTIESASGEILRSFELLRDY